MPSRIRDSITLALPGRNWPFLFVRRSRAPPWEVNIPVASIPTFKAFPADIDRRDTGVLRYPFLFLLYEATPCPVVYHSRTPFTTYRTPLGNARRGYVRCISIDDMVIGNQGTKSIVIVHTECKLKMEDLRNGLELICMFV